MPKNQATDPITNQEITFAHLVLSGTMTDRNAAEAAGLNPDTAAYTKAKPRVRAYMLDHRAAVQEQLVEQDTEGLRRLDIGRERVLARLWEIANLSPEMTRNSVAAQVKALTMIVAIEGLIPDHRAVSSEKKSAPLPKVDIYPAAWLSEQQGKTAPDPSPDSIQEGIGLGVPKPPTGVAAEAPPFPGIRGAAVAVAEEVKRSTKAGSLGLGIGVGVIPASFERDTREPFSIKKGRFGKR